MAPSSAGKGKGRALADNDADLKDITKGLVLATMGSYITVIDTFKNIAPIMDAVLVDTDGSGQVRVFIHCIGPSSQ